MPRRYGALERIGLLIQREGAFRPPESVDTAPIAYRDWEAAVGTRIAARARPVKLDRGVLHVRASSSTWAQELALLGDAIAAQLRTRGFKVQSLRFRVGQVDPPDRPPWRDEVRAEPPAAPLPPEVQQELARVPDEELRAAIARAASKNLGWQAAEAKAVTSPRRAAPDPRSATPGSARPDRTKETGGGAPRGKP